MQPIPEDEFVDLVADGLDLLPPELAELVDNVVVTVADDHPEGLLGLYEGVALTDRAEYGYGELPDVVTLYRLPLCRSVATPEDLAEEVAVTVIHELAHHFGIDDERLAELGWD